MNKDSGGCCSHVLCDMSKLPALSLLINRDGAQHMLGIFQDPFKVNLTHLRMAFIRVTPC